MPGPKASLSKLKEIEIIPCIISDHHGMKLEIHNLKKLLNMQTLKTEQQATERTMLHRGNQKGNKYFWK